MNILAIGDVVSEIGCNFVRQKLPSLKKVKGIDLCIANGENSAVGNGITPHSAQFLFDSGVDVITTGNHAFRRKEIYDFFDTEKNIIRPENYYVNAPGKGYVTVDLGYSSVTVINLSGSIYMDTCDNPFMAADSILEKINSKIIMVDFHAEATSEKGAMAYYLDGRVSGIFGTHTHVMTADAKILPGSTGFITDIGMTGPKNSILGVKPEISVNRLKTGMPARFDTAEGECMMNACVFGIDNSSGKCISIEPLIIE
ncbi:MAG: TIGR00282 family metallophosphoesterase [Clostridia bacterium]|nr:TIGR00282 family metallophosphoesterase [Clostridia bacterium]